MNSLLKIILFLSFLSSTTVYSQQADNKRHDGARSKASGDALNYFYHQEWENLKQASQSKVQIDADTSVDILFYHLDLTIAIDSQYLSGSVYIRLTPTVPNVSSLKLQLHSSLQADSVVYDGIALTGGNNQLLITLGSSFNPGDIIELKIYYHGVPVLANGIKGLRYTLHGNNEPVIATLSTPFLSNYWWPCKDGPGDKADSVYVDLTIRDTVVNGFQLMAVSNGMLEEVDSSNGIWRTYKWKHRYPIVPYYVMAAISNYRIISQTYTGTNTVFPLTYYTFDEKYNQTLAGVVQMPAAMDRFSELFGDYPFKNEQYSMTELGFYGAIENQTNTIINNMDSSWYYVSAHELAHQWFGDLITCKDWHHAWLNEGFASYAEALVEEHLHGSVAYADYMTSKEWYSGGTIYLPQDTDAFAIFQGILYSKGAYVLHMLRGALGDSVFFNCLHTYATSALFAYDHSVTEDFRQVCETVSGQNLQVFFDQWIYDQYYPKYKYNFYSNPSVQTTALTIFQEQGPVNGWRPVFRMPLQLLFSFSNGNDTLITVLNDQQFQTWYFSFTDSVTAVSIDPGNWVLKNAAFDPGINVSVQEVNRSNGFTIYPNPARDYISVHLKNPVPEIVRLQVLDLYGKILVDQTGTDPLGSFSCPLDFIPSGIYLIRLSSGTFEYKDKFVLLR